MNMPNSVIDISTINPKQALFFKARTRYTAYGGARGGGKSWALRKKITLMCVKYAGIRILLLRRTYPELKENHVYTLLAELEGIAKYKETDKIFTFPNGSTIKLGYCASEKDVTQYQGNEYDVICLDEATQFTEYQYQTLTACLRGANNFPKRMYLTCNPGGVGHEWVKRLFISRRYKASEKPEDYTFIAATVFDNKVLLEKDQEYVNMLNNLNDGLRQAWRDGNWDMLAGRYFSEFDRSVHVIEPFAIPEHWRRYRAIDYGLDCLACVWAAVDELGNYYIYREYAESDKIISDGAHDIVSLSEGEHIQFTAAPPDMWSRSQESAKSKADLFAEGGLVLIKSSNDRESGWLAIKDLMKVHDVTETQKESRLKIFSSCTNLIECIPALQRNSKKPNDCMTEPHDITHLPDALRYLCVQFAAAATPIKPKKTDFQRHIEKCIKENRRRSYW